MQIDGIQKINVPVDVPVVKNNVSTNVEWLSFFSQPLHGLESAGKTSISGTTKSNGGGCACI